MRCCKSGSSETNTWASGEFKQRPPSRIHTLQQTVQKNMMYEEINGLWVSCVSRWGCLSDSVFNVLPTLSASALTKRYLTEREGKREKAPRRWAQLPWSYPSIVSNLCLHARRCVFDFTIFSSTIIWNGFSSTISNSQKAPVILRRGWYGAYSLISADDYSCSNKNRAQRWYLNSATCVVNLKNTLSCYSTLPVTASDAWYSRKNWLQDSDYFDKRSRPQNTGQGRGGIYAQRRHWNFEYVRVITWPLPRSPLDPWLKTCIHYLLTERHFLSCSTIILCEQRWTGGESCCYASYRPQTWQPGLNCTWKNSWAKMLKEYIWAKIAVLSQHKLLLFDGTGELNSLRKD